MLCMPETTKMKRFTVSLDARDYDAFRHIAESHRTTLSLQYVIRYALQEFLDHHEGKQLTLKLAKDEQR